MKIDTLLFLIDLLTEEQNLFPTSYEYTFPLQKDTDKCDIIEIAEKELENIDTTNIDHEFEQIMQKEQTIKLITEIKHGITKNIKKYTKNLNDPDILDLRTTNKNLYIKTTKPIIQTTLANILAINENMIEPIPINGKYNWYLINCEKWGATHIRRKH